MTNIKMACITTIEMASTFLSQPGGITTDLILPPGESTMVQAFKGKFEVIGIEPLCKNCEHYIDGICSVSKKKMPPTSKCQVSSHPKQFKPVFTPSSKYRNLSILEGDDLEKYDYLLVNVSPVLLPKVFELRKQLGYGSSTVLFGNMDHGIDIASRYFRSYYQLRDGLSQLDMIFSVEPVQRAFVKRMLPMREVHDIPHCIDIEKHKKIGDMFKDKRAELEVKNIMVTYHEYEHPVIMPISALSDPRLAELNPLLIGYDFGCNTCMLAPTCKDKRPGGVCDKYTIGFDGFKNGLRKKPYPAHMREMAEIGNIGYETYQIAGIGRYGMQWASMGIPAFVPNVNRSHKLFDYEPTHPKNFKQIGNILARIHQNRKGWTDELIETAYQRVKDEYSFEVVREKVISAIEREVSKN